MAWYSKFYDETGLIEVGGVQLPARSWFGDTPDAELKQYADSVERLEASGELDNLFKGPCADPVEHPSKGKVMESIKPGMRLFKSLFTRIYGYELTDLGFAGKALDRLKEAGCSRAQEYYDNIVKECTEKYEETAKSAAEYLREHKDEEGADKWKNKEKRKEAEQLKEDLQKKSDRELLTLLQRLRAENTL